MVNTRHQHAAAAYGRCFSGTLFCLACLACCDASRRGLGLLQVTKSTLARSCQLPEGGTWAEVRLAGLSPFQMAVRTGNDALSKEILEKGYWEVQDPSIWGAPGEALDIGGNIGYYTFALANAGWRVRTFEPIEYNRAFLKATLCQNPILAERIKLHEMGLGVKNEDCSMVVWPGNVGNGLVRCSQADVGDAEWERVNLVQAGSFKLRRLEDVLHEEGISKIDFVKMDVEGYECEALKGAGVDFLSKFRPRLFKSEVWKDMVRCTSLEFFSMFENAGYRLGMDADPGCAQHDWKDDPHFAETTKLWAVGSNFYMCRND